MSCLAWDIRHVDQRQFTKENRPMLKRLLICTVLLVSASGFRTSAADFVPFKATWTGVTVSADPTGAPIIAIVSAGQGHGTQLGAFTMVTPHTSNIQTFELAGDHVFTAANGDTLTAHFVGLVTPTMIDGNPAVTGVVPCIITGGTGRFEGATGTYNFTLTAILLPDGSGFASTATMDGVISSVGSSQ
jgi:hypothetical protein